MNSSLISQIVLVIISVVLIVMYIRPGFETVNNLQDEQQQLEDAIETANEFTRELNSLQAKVGSITPSNMSALTTYLPDETDRLTTMWVLESIAAESNVSIASISSAENSENESESTPDTVNGAENIATDTAGPKGLVLTVGISGSYDNFKDFLSLLEMNEFPFLTQQLTIGNTSSEDSGTEQTESEAGTYTLNLLVPEYQPASDITTEPVDDMEMDLDMF